MFNPWIKKKEESSKEIKILLPGERKDSYYGL